MVLNRLRENGDTIVFITHKLREVAAVSDRVTVIRRGQTVGLRETKETTSEELAALMVGRDVSLRVERTPAKPTEPVLEARDLVVAGKGERPALDHCSFTLRRGEIVGICGVEGNGQAELIESLAGLRRPDSGRVILKGTDVTSQGRISDVTRG
ncbi:MAG: ATP-binding cassette domain-containing protein [Thermomicrobiales bacterium]